MAVRPTATATQWDSSHGKVSMILCLVGCLAVQAACLCAGCACTRWCAKPKLADKNTQTAKEELASETSEDEPAAVKYKKVESSGREGATSESWPGGAMGSNPYEVHSAGAEGREQ